MNIVKFFNDAANLFVASVVISIWRPLIPIISIKGYKANLLATTFII